MHASADTVSRMLGLEDAWLPEISPMRKAIGTGASLSSAVVDHRGESVTKRT